LINDIPRSNIEDRGERIEDIGMMLFQASAELVLIVSCPSRAFFRISLPLI
jgi:hypothetical protein